MIDEDKKRAVERFLAILKGYDATGLGRLGQKIATSSHESIAATEIQIVRHRAFNREHDAKRCEEWLAQHGRDMELGRAIMEISAMMSAEELVAAYVSEQKKRRRANGNYPPAKKD